MTKFTTNTTNNSKYLHHTHTSLCTIFDHAPSFLVFSASQILLSLFFVFFGAYFLVCILLLNLLSQQTLI